MLPILFHIAGAKQPDLAWCCVPVSQTRSLFLFSVCWHFDTHYADAKSTHAQRSPFFWIETQYQADLASRQHATDTGSRRHRAGDEQLAPALYLSLGYATCSKRDALAYRVLVCGTLGEWTSAT